MWNLDPPRQKGGELPDQILKLSRKLIEDGEFNKWLVRGRQNHSKSWARRALRNFMRVVVFGLLSVMHSFASSAYTRLNLLDIFSSDGSASRSYCWELCLKIFGDVLSWVEFWGVVVASLTIPSWKFKSTHPTTTEYSIEKLKYSLSESFSSLSILNSKDSYLILRYC